MSLLDDILITKLKTTSAMNHRLFLLIPSHLHLTTIFNLHSQIFITPKLSILYLYKTLDPLIKNQYSDSVSFYSYNETDKILGNTFKMLVLQDYESITPNILARSVETVQGGGIIILVTDDIRGKDMEFVMENVGKKRFNNRVFKSMMYNENILVFDENFYLYKNKVSLNCKKYKESKTLKCVEDDKKVRMSGDDIRKMIDNENINQIFQAAKTDDQYSVLTSLVETLSERSCKTVCSITAARGRGKSAALGLAISLAIYKSYSTIYVAAPNLENIGTIFEFIIKGINLLGYKERINYTVYKKNINRRRYVYKIVFTKTHRQVIEYVCPYVDMCTFPDLLVVDEAASIPIPHIKKMLGANLVFMASTVSGYEGTGRSISVKLFNELRDKCKLEKLFLFKEFELIEPIRYANNDPIENWLNELLFLNAIPSSIGSCPAPDACNLFYINKDVLFQFHSQSEMFLKNLVALFVASHYKNSPNDLMLMADIDNHHLFTLLSPINEDSPDIPNILCAIQVVYENIEDRTNREGNLIPWTLYDNYLNTEYLKLKGIRIVRIAVHPDHINMGYGTRAVELLCDFYLNKEEPQTNCDKSLIIPLSKTKREPVEYIGTSFGATNELVNFWKKNRFTPIYLRQAQSKITGENSLIMLRGNTDFIQNLHVQHQIRFIKLLSSSFKHLKLTLCLTLFYYKGMQPIKLQYKTEFTEMERNRLEAFSKGLVEIGVVYELIHQFALLFFMGQTGYELNVLEQCILMGMGMQFRSGKEMAGMLKIEKQRVVSVLSRIIIRIYNGLNK